MSTDNIFFPEGIRKISVLFGWKKHPVWSYDSDFTIHVLQFRLFSFTYVEMPYVIAG